MDIGDQVAPIWNEYRRIQRTKDEASMRLGHVELTVQDTTVRVAVSDRAWVEGLGFEDAVNRIISELTSGRTHARDEARAL